MKQTRTQSGFTLVELAIVMTIIGLLIGGILKGQELMQNARVTSTIAQVRAYEAATTTFRDKYDAIPGDMANAATRIPGCDANCNFIAANNPNAGVGRAATGDSIVGDAAWAAAAGGAWGNQTTTLQGGNETMLFWTHLLLSDLISGVTNAHVIAASTPAAGTTHPAPKLGGVFIVGHGDGTVPPGHPNAAAGTGPQGMILTMVTNPQVALPANQGPLLATRAAQIDRKMDDGRPEGGYVHASGGTGLAGANPADAGNGNVCYNAAAAAAPYAYLESDQQSACGLIFRIQG